MKILITGITGFVGQNLLLKLLMDSRYTKVFLPVRNKEKFYSQLKRESIVALPEKFVVFESESPTWIIPPEAKDVDQVLHMAGTLFANSKLEYFNTNVEGTHKLLSQFTKPKLVVVLSSQAATGPSKNLHIKKELDSDNPVTWYGESKFEMEKMLKQNFSHLNYICLRPPIVIGPRDQATLPLFKIVNFPVFFKPGFHSKNYSYIGVHDLVTAILTVLKTDTKFDLKYYYVTSGDLTDETLIKTTALVRGKKGKLIPIPHFIIGFVAGVFELFFFKKYTPKNLTKDRIKEIWPRGWLVSSQKFRTDFNWKSQDTLESILKETNDYYVGQGLLSPSKDLCLSPQNKPSLSS
jgi:nucleoside-diphosphate-sugar epimerase